MKRIHKRTCSLQNRRDEDGEAHSKPKFQNYPLSSFWTVRQKDWTQQEKKKLYYRTEHHISVSSDSDRLSWISGCRASKNNKFNIQNVTYIIETTWHKSRSLVIKKFQNEPQKSEAWNTLRWWLTALNGQNKDSDPPLLIVMQK